MLGFSPDREERYPSCRLRRFDRVGGTDVVVDAPGDFVDSRQKCPPEFSAYSVACPVLLVLHFGVVHEDDCRQLSTTQDWVPLDEVPEETLSGLELQHCPVCQT